MDPVTLREETHPNPEAQRSLDGLVGLDRHRDQLAGELISLLDPDHVRRWQARHHPQGLPIAERLQRRTPLVLLSGEVGCGKTALARAIATQVGKAMNTRVTVFETPSDLRGSGLVGEISARITAAFTEARQRTGHRPGLLLFDEADDVATSRAQNQAHHEDRAGLNVLVRQLDLLSRDRVRLAVILITNRVDVLDPAIRRRASLHLRFHRPDAATRRALFERLLEGAHPSPEALDQLSQASDSSPVPYSAADLVERVAEAALREAVRLDHPLTPNSLLAALAEVTPSPLVEGAPLP